MGRSGIEGGGTSSGRQMVIMNVLMNMHNEQTLVRTRAVLTWPTKSR